MEYVRFGKTGMKVSRICVGCMSYGTSKWQPWVLDEEPSIELIKKCWDAGINFFDTADVYSNGESEKVLGKALKDLNIPRSQVVIATKVFWPVSDDITEVFAPLDTSKTLNKSGLSRKYIFEAVERSLERLGTDYIDLYQIHRFDYNTSVEETMEALNDLVKMGKVRYIGASSMWAWQFAKMNAVAEKNGWTKFVSMQNFYNLIYREEEREMIPLLKDQGIAMIPYSPLASGALSGTKKGDTVRSESAIFRMPGGIDQDNTIINRVIEIAEKMSKDGTVVTPAQVGMAWIFSKDFITAPICGIGKEKYLNDALIAMKLKLDDEDIKYLESVYAPKPVMGHM